MNPLPGANTGRSIKNDLEASVFRIFGNNRVSFDGPHAQAAAEKYASDLPKHLELIIEVSRKFLLGAGADNFANQVIPQIRAHVLLIVQRNGPIRIDAVDGRYEVYSEYPLINMDAVSNLDLYISNTSGNNFETKIMKEWVGSLIIAEVLSNYRSPEVDFSFNNLNIFALQLFQALSYISAIKAMEDGVSATSLKLGVIESELSHTSVKISSVEAQAREASMAALSSANEIAELTEAIKAAYNDLSTFQNQAESIKTVLIEQAGLKATDNLWKRQARLGFLSYLGSLLALLVPLVLGPILILVFNQEVLAFVARIEAAAFANITGEGVAVTVAAVSRLLMITAPFALIVWAIKLIVRFNIRSMLLMDDAQQRVTMLNTYLFLVDKNVANIQDRGALLEAMFRRAPGHGPEAIEPPSMTDIMKYGDTMK